MSDFANIEKLQGNRNMGGVWRKFRFIPVEEVSEIPFYEEDNIETDIELTDDAGWFYAWAVFETLGFKEKPIGESGNPTGYEVELPGEFAKDTPGLLTQVQKMEGKRFFILAEDHNGQTCLIGNTQKDKNGVYKGIRFGSMRDSGTKVAERNGYAFSFKGQQPVRSPFYQATIVEAPSDCPAATVTFVDEDGDPIASLPDKEVNSGATSEQVIPNVEWTDSDGEEQETNYGQAIVCTPQVKDVFIKFPFAATADETTELTIDADNAGTFTASSQDGSSGTITYNINSGGFAAFSNPTVLEVGDTIAAKRTTTTGAGYAKISGTYA